MNEIDTTLFDLMLPKPVDHVGPNREFVRGRCMSGSSELLSRNTPYKPEEIIEFLEVQDAPVSARTVSDELDIDEKSTMHSLKKLVESGKVIRLETISKGRKVYLYVLAGRQNEYHVSRGALVHSFVPEGLGRKRGSRIR